MGNAMTKNMADQDNVEYQPERKEPLPNLKAVNATQPEE